MGIEVRNADAALNCIEVPVLPIKFVGIEVQLTNRVLDADALNCIEVPVLPIEFVVGIEVQLVNQVRDADALNCIEVSSYSQSSS